MNKIFHYINTMYRPSFIVLTIELTIISTALTLLAVSLRAEILAGETDVIYRYPKMIEELVLRATIFLPPVFLIDLNERKKKAD